MRKRKSAIVGNRCSALPLLWLETGEVLSFCEPSRRLFIPRAQKTIATLLKLNVDEPSLPCAVLNGHDTLRTALFLLPRFMLEMLYKELCYIRLYISIDANDVKLCRYKITVFLCRVCRSYWRKIVYFVQVFSSQSFQKFQIDQQHS